MWPWASHLLSGLQAPPSPQLSEEGIDLLGDLTGLTVSHLHTNSLPCPAIRFSIITSFGIGVKAIYNFSCYHPPLGVMHSGGCCPGCRSVFLFILASLSSSGYGRGCPFTFIVSGSVIGCLCTSTSHTLVGLPLVVSSSSWRLQCESLLLCPLLLPFLVPRVEKKREALLCAGHLVSIG